MSIKLKLKNVRKRTFAITILLGWILIKKKTKS